MYVDMQSRTAERLISVPFSARGLGDQQSAGFLDTAFRILNMSRKTLDINARKKKKYAWSAKEGGADGMDG